MNISNINSVVESFLRDNQVIVEPKEGSKTDLERMQELFNQVDIFVQSSENRQVVEKFKSLLDRIQIELDSSVSTEKVDATFATVHGCISDQVQICEEQLSCLQSSKKIKVGDQTSSAAVVLETDAMELGGGITIRYSNAAELIEGYVEAVNDKQPGFLDIEKVKTTIKALANKELWDRPSLLSQDSGNDRDDQIALHIYAIMMALKSIDPQKSLVIGIPNPIGVDANKEAVDYLQKFDTKMPDECYFTAPVTTVLYQPKNPWAPQSQKISNQPALMSYSKTHAERNNHDFLQLICENTPATFSIGSAASGMSSLFFKPDAFSQAIRGAYLESIHINEASIRENLKVDQLPSYESIDLTNLSPELALQIYNSFKTQLAEILKRDPSIYCRPELLDSDNKPKNLSHIRMFYQGTKDLGQNQKFHSLFTTAGEPVDVKYYSRAKTDKTPVIGVPDAFLLDNVLREVFKFQLTYCAENPKIVVKEEMVNNLGPKGLDVLSLDVLDGYETDNIHAGLPALLLNGKNFSVFFNDPGFPVSKSFSPNAHPYRSLLNLLSSSKLSGNDVEESLKEKNSSFKQIIVSCLAKIADSVDKKILEGIPPEDQINILFDNIYTETSGMALNWNPIQRESKDFSSYWKALTGNENYPNIEEIKGRLKGLLQKTEGAEIEFADAFAVELLHLHADGMAAQKSCIEKRVQGTQEACCKLVRGEMREDFLNLFKQSISIAPFDVENFRKAFLPDADFETLTKLFILNGRLFNELSRITTEKS